MTRALGLALSLAASGVAAGEPDPVDRVVDALLRAEALPTPYYEHFDVSPDGRFVAFTLARGQAEDDAGALGDLRKLPGGIPATSCDRTCGWPTAAPARRAV